MTLGLSMTPIPAAVVVPVAAMVIAWAASRALALNASTLPTQRRRIRVTISILTMLLAGAVSLGLIVPVNHAGDGLLVFLRAWMIVAGLLSTLVMLASLDIAITIRAQLLIRAHSRAQLQAFLREHTHHTLATASASASNHHHEPRRRTPRQQQRHTR